MTSDEPMRDRTTPAPRPHGRGARAAPSRGTERKLWFGVLGGPIAWSLHEIAGVAYVGRTCEQVYGLADWQWLALVGSAILAAAITIAAGLTSLRIFRDWKEDGGITETEGRNRVEFMAFAGVVVSGFMLLSIVLFGIMPLVVDPCVRTR